MYESPIEVYYKDMRTKIENNIFEAVCNVGVSVDKDELVKALQYDRGQYEKGYADGLCHRTDDWISVDERLPDKSGQYLTWHGFYCGLHDYSVEKQGWNITYCEDRSTEIKTVTHWMPFPEPPKGD